MNVKGISTLASYVATGCVAIMMALFISSQFLKVAHSQDSNQVPSEAVEVAVEAGAAALSEVVEKSKVIEVNQEEMNLFLEPYNYDPRGRRDPFIQIGDYAKGQQLRPLMPLERFELEEIRLIGIIWNVKTPKAMFMDPEDQVYVLAKNQRIGRNQGYIAVIREGEVVIVEAGEKNGETVYDTKVVRITE